MIDEHVRVYCARRQREFVSLIFLFVDPLNHVCAVYFSFCLYSNDYRFQQQVARSSVNFLKKANYLVPTCSSGGFKQ